MKGHTNNRVLLATLESTYQFNMKRAQHCASTGDKVGEALFEGKAMAAGEIGIYLNIINSSADLAAK